MIKLNPPYINVEETMPLVEEVLRSGILTQGPMVEELEALSAQMAGTKFAVAVSNATVGLELVLGSMRLEKDDEVITTPFTFRATVNAVLRAGATPRYADILDDYTIDPESVKNLINDKTRAIIPVHMYGYPADVDALRDIAGDGPVIIEDAAQAHGARYYGVPVGGLGLAGVFSFYGTKNVAAGEGGIITTNNEELYNHLLQKRSHQTSRSRYRGIPTNARMSELNAAVAIPQLRNLKIINDIRRSNKAQLVCYTGQDAQYDPNRRGNSHLYTIEDDNPQDLINFMKSRGVECASYYRYIHDSDMIRIANAMDKFNKAYVKASRVVSLPVHPGLSEYDIETIGEAYLARP